MAESARIAALPVYGCLDLRLDPRNEAAASAVASALDAALPGPNTWVTAGSAQVLWQAYDEWLILTADGRQTAFAASLHSALADAHGAVTDVTDLRAAFRLQGPRARDVLQKGCAVDLHPRVFGPASCVTTALARVRVTLRQVEAEPAYEILVERSYAAYLRDWLEDAVL
jgi:sarcosine oxidase subunit gamma